MTTRKKKKNNIDVGYYLVAFVDILGQQDHLRELKSLPVRKDSEEYNSLISVLKQTYGAVAGMRKLFHSFFLAYSTRSIDISQLTKEQQKDGESYKSSNKISEFLRFCSHLFTSSNRQIQTPDKGHLWDSLCNCHNVFM